MKGKGKDSEKAAEPQTPDTSVAPAAVEEKVPTYRADMGEGLPPQQPPTTVTD